MFSKSASVVAVIAGVGISQAAFAAAFTAGNLVVSRIGVGSAALTGNTAAVFLDELTPAGSGVQSVAIPTAAFSKGFGMTIGGNSSSQGQLERSVDGRFLTIFGYDAPVGLAGPSSAASNRGRTIVRVSARGDQGILANTRIEQGGSTPRAAKTIDGSSYYTAADGGSGPSGGLRYHLAGAIVNGVLMNGTTTNIRTVNIFNNQLYIGASTAGGGVEARGVSTIGTGIPTASDTITILPGMGGSNTGLADSAYDFHFTNSSTLYIADDDFTAPASGGLQKWTRTGSVWSKQWTALAGTGIGVRSLTAAVTGSGTVIYAVTSEATGNRIVTLTDTGVGTPSFSTVSTAPTNTIYRGVEFSPIPEPASLAVLAGAGLLVARRRR